MYSKVLIFPTPTKKLLKEWWLGSVPFKIQKINFCFACSFAVTKGIGCFMALHIFSSDDDNVSACLGDLRKVQNM